MFDLPRVMTFGESSREEAKRLFRTGKANVLLCTDAAAEGLSHRERVRATNTSNKTEAFDDRRITVKRNR